MHRVDFDVQAEYEQNSSGIVIPVQLKLDSKRFVKFAAKIDTGSEYCLFERRYAEILGLDVEAGHPIRCRTATGSIENAFGHELTLASLGFEFSGTYYFFAEPEAPRSLLGRLGWLNRLRLAIDDTANPGLLLASRA
ncbi:MAG: hypothetical protein U0Q16_29120 [Bryobacteraceae bacterium]